jgi:hypothetical protein
VHGAWLDALREGRADDWTNSESKSFDSSRRLDVDLDKLNFGVLPALFAEGDRSVEELANLKLEARRMDSQKGLKKKRLAGDTLRDRDPW